MANECAGNPGTVAPVVDRNRCEGEEQCVQVCPYNVFEVRVLAPAERSELPLLGRLKAWAHGNRQAFVVRPADCHACRLCITACPEQALHLAPTRT
jgi:4Fe-4S ferredoxin